MQAFYGGDPAGWLDMPMSLLRAYQKMLPVLSAQRMLRDVNVQRLATSGRKSRQRLQELSKQAREPGPKPAATPEGLASRGATVKRAAMPTWGKELTGV